MCKCCCCCCCYCWFYRATYVYFIFNELSLRIGFSCSVYSVPVITLTFTSQSLNWQIYRSFQHFFRLPAASFQKKSILFLFDWSLKLTFDQWSAFHAIDCRWGKRKPCLDLKYCKKSNTFVYTSFDPIVNRVLCANRNRQHYMPLFMKFGSRVNSL